MSKKEAKIVKGMYNSSITRVRPFFRALFEIDNTGISWLPELMRAMPLNNELTEKLSNLSNRISDECLQEREYNDEIMCFEYSIPPSRGFLEWALNNFHLLTWPEKGNKKFGTDTQFRRECLLGLHGDDLQETIKRIGIESLTNLGVSRSSRAWWAFEGYTEMDCLIETDDYLLGIEGKRTEFVSSSTYWFKDRNQVVRNLEVLAEMAKERGKDYAFILLTENGVDPMTQDHFIKSMPHNRELADELLGHYLGCMSWQNACEVTHVSTNCLLEDVTSVQNGGAKCSHFENGQKNEEQKPRVRDKDYKLLRMHGKVAPKYNSSEAKLRNDLFMVGALNITIGKGEYRKIRLIGYEVPLYCNRDECIDLLGYDEKHNLYVIELKINNSKNPRQVSKQINKYVETIKHIVINIAEEIKAELHLADFTFSGNIIKLALVPKVYHEQHDKSQWDRDILVCSIQWRTDICNLVENRGTIGHVTLDIIENKDYYVTYPNLSSQQ